MEGGVWLGILPWRLDFGSSLNTGLLEILLESALDGTSALPLGKAAGVTGLLEIWVESALDGTSALPLGKAAGVTGVLEILVESALDGTSALPLGKAAGVTGLLENETSAVSFEAAENRVS